MLRRVTGTPRSAWSVPVTSFAFTHDALRCVVRGPNGNEVHEIDPRRPTHRALVDVDPKTVVRAPYADGARASRSPSGRRTLRIDRGRLCIDDHGGSTVQVEVPPPCLETFDYYRWLDDDTLIWTETGLVFIDARTGARDIVWPVREEDARDRFDGRTYIDVSPDLAWVARQTDEGLEVAPLSVVDPEGPLAPWVGTSGRISPDALRRAIAQGGEVSEERRTEAEGLANAIAHALRTWGVDVGMSCRWAARADDFVALEPIGLSVQTLVQRAHREAEVDGHAGVVQSSEPYVRAFDEGFAHALKERRFEVDHRRETDVFADVDYRSAVAWGLEVGSGPHEGRRFAELPNPFAPMLALFGLGLAARRADRNGIELVAL